MTATVTRPCLINGEPQNVGATVEVDGQTFANLSRKGWLVGAGGAATTPGDSQDAAGGSLPAEGEAPAVTAQSKTKRKTK